MHRALAILEITENICEELNDALSSKDGRKSLAALARTGKVFEDPALDVLWRKQDTLDNILKCLPSKLWDVAPGPRGGDAKGTFRLARVPQAANWARPFHYARRVRDLRLSSSWSSPFPTEEVLEAIKLHFAPGFLCPNLRIIDWKPDSSLFPYIRLFLGPRITQVYLDVPPNPANIPVLSTLAIPYHQLKTMRVCSSTDDTSFLRRASANIALKLAQIETLDLDTLDRAALEHLSTLPALKSLNLRIVEPGDLGPPSSLMPSRPRNPTFPALRTVEFFASSVQFAIEFANMLSACSLDTFDLGTDVLASNVTTGELFRALAAGVSHPTLTSIVVSDIDADIASPTPPAGTMSDYAITGPTLALLFCFCNLTSVRLRTPAGFDIDDLTAGDIARAWPRIQRLDLGSCTDMHHPSRMTLLGLRSLATHCKDLTWLHITLDASTVPPFDNSPERRISQRSLCSFDVAMSPISDPAVVARFVSALFPNLDEITTHNDWDWEDPNDQDDTEEMAMRRAYFHKWKQVETLVPMISAIRAEERRWAEMGIE
ncbi:hypothetical protein C8R46DRAFT_1342408 [Mycena filopes]|nr:hypothetical protein C8R46DRAFT_1342408 [Mycena filopes]